MAIKVPTASAAADKWKTVTPQRSAFYTSGVAGAANDYQTGVSGAQETYNQGVTEAMGRQAWGKGVEGKGAKYSRKAQAVGAQRWQQGVPAAAEDYQAGVAPFLQGLSSISLPPRGPKGSPGNIARVTAVNDTLRAIKMGR